MNNQENIGSQIFDGVGHMEDMKTLARFYLVLRLGYEILRSAWQSKQTNCGEGVYAFNNKLSWP